MNRERMSTRTLSRSWFINALGEHPSRILLFAQIIFFVCIILLYLYLLSVRLYIPLPSALYWVSVVTAILSVIFQVINLPPSNDFKLLLFEVIVLSFSLDLTFLIPLYGFGETDSYLGMIFTRKIVESNYLPTASLEYPVSLVFWPTIEIWAAELHHVTSISVFSIAKWLPSIVIHSLFVLVSYSFVKKIFEDQRIALLSTLLLSTVQIAFQYSSKFHYENYGQVILMTGLLLIALRGKDKGVAYSILILLCLAAAIFAHHFTSLVMVIFLAIQFVVTRITSSPRGVILLGTKSRDSRMFVTIELVAFAIVAVFSYWLYIYTWPLIVMVRWGLTILHGDPTSTLGQLGYGLPQTWLFLRGQIIYWGFILFHVVFAFILLSDVLFRRRGKITEFYTLACLFYACALLSFIQVYVRTTTTSLNHFRLIAWGWFFGVAPIVVAVVKGNPRLGRNVGMLLLVGFMIFNVYEMDNTSRDTQTARREWGDITLMEDYTLAKTVTLTEYGTAFHRTKLAIWDVQGLLWTDLTSVTADQIDTLDWIVIKKKELARYIAVGSYDAYGQFPVEPWKLNTLGKLIKGQSSERNKVYESTNLQVFRSRY